MDRDEFHCGRISFGGLISFGIGLLRLGYEIPDEQNRKWTECGLWGVRLLPNESRIYNHSELPLARQRYIIYMNPGQWPVGIV